MLLDIAGDAAAAFGVAVAGAIILVGGWLWLDPLAALIIAAAVGFHAVRLLRKITATLRASHQPRRPGGILGLVMK